MDSWARRVTALHFGWAGLEGRGALRVTMQDCTAIDPVAMDRVGWQIIDGKRKAEGLPPLADSGKKGQRAEVEAFDHRQPQHVLLAGEAGLGEADLQSIEHRTVRLG